MNGDALGQWGGGGSGARTVSPSIQINEEWRFASRVLDRLFFFAFLIANLVGTGLILVAGVPFLSESVDQTKIIDIYQVQDMD